jgi:hypothetical protein
MSYNEISSIIESWASAHGFSLMKEDHGPERRFFYVSSVEGETFQFVIEPERDGLVRMDAHMIESPTDQEAHFVWEVPKSQTEHGLDLGLSSAQAWFKRN